MFFPQKYQKNHATSLCKSTNSTFFLSASVDLTFEYPHAMVHACLLPNKYQKITQPLTINLKKDINLETCSSRSTTYT